MGREIRRVPPGWEHPKDDAGKLLPMLDGLYEEEARAWLENCVAWERGDHPHLIDGSTTKEEHPFWWDWGGGPPDRDGYRPAYSEEPTHYQVYETVSEGTPTSPVFATEEELVNWLVDQGHSEAAAQKFVRVGHAYSFVMQGGTLMGGIDAMGEGAR